MIKNLDSTIPSERSKSVSAASAIALTEQMHSLVSEIQDPRVQRTLAHLLVDIIIIGILSVIAGGKGGKTWKHMD